MDRIDLGNLAMLQRAWAKSMVARGRTMVDAMGDDGIAALLAFLRRYQTSVP